MANLDGFFPGSFFSPVTHTLPLICEYHFRQKERKKERKKMKKKEMRKIRWKERKTEKLRR